MWKVRVIQTPGSYSILPPESVVDPDLLNRDLDTDPVFQENLDPCDVFLRLMSAHLVILWRVIPLPPSMDMKQYRYLNFDKSHPLILNYHQKVLGYVPQ